MELWNEPWEGVSISGWGADIPRFREIYTVMAQAVIEARKEAGVKVLIGGACSSTNTRDKLFCDGTDTFLPWLDFVSIHYQPLAADPVLEPKWMNRTGEYGRVKVWDTESWVANSDDRVAGGHRLHARHGPGPHGRHLRRQRLYLGKAPRGRQGVRRGPGLGAGRGGGRHPALHRPARRSRRFSSRTACRGCLSSTAWPRQAGGERTGPADPDDGTRGDCWAT